MNVKDMKVGLRYIVTRSSINEEFQVGDRIRLLDNGDILLQGQGWMEKEYIDVATEGMEVELDKDYFRQQKLKHLQAIKELDTLL